MRKHGADASPPVHAVRGCSTDDDPDRSTTMIWLRFESHLAAEPPSVWLHATQMRGVNRSEEHTSELQSLMRISYAVFCLKKNKTTHIKQRKSNAHTHIKLEI